MKLLRGFALLAPPLKYIVKYFCFRLFWINYEKLTEAHLVLLLLTNVEMHLFGFSVDLSRLAVSIRLASVSHLIVVLNAHFGWWPQVEAVPYSEQ